MLQGFLKKKKTEKSQDHVLSVTLLLCSIEVSAVPVFVMTMKSPFPDSLQSQLLFSRKLSRMHCKMQIARYQSRDFDARPCSRKLASSSRVSRMLRAGDPYFWFHDIDSQDRVVDDITVLKKTMNALASEATRQNKFYISDFRYASQISVYLLKPFGAWPLIEKDISLFKIVLHKLSIVIVTFLQIFFFLPWIVLIVKEKWGVIMILRTMCPLLYVVTVFVRYLLLLWHQERLKSCINHVSDDWRYTIHDEDREVMLANVKLGRTFGIVSVGFMFSCGILFFSLPLALPNIVTEDNVTIRQHPVPCEFFVFDSKVKLWIHFILLVHLSLFLHKSNLYNWTYSIKF